MEPIEIIVLIAAISIVAGVIGNYIYKKVTNKPTGECSCCQHSKKGSALVNAYHKKYKKKST